MSGPDAAAPDYQVYAIRYATREGTRAANFLGGDPHDGPMRTDYFVWVAVSAAQAVVVDLGFSAETAGRRGRDFLRCPIETLGRIGVDADKVATVIVTHLHYDHVGNADRFPNAVFHLQEAEMQHACGRHIHHLYLRQAFEVDDIVGMVRLNFAGRVRLHTGAAEIAPGISVQLAGGHSGGLQFVRIKTRRGWLVLASDVSHFYENMETMRPFALAYDVGAMFDGFRKLHDAATDASCIIPGHDPEVMRRYPPARAGLEGAVARLDLPPVAP